MSNLKEKIRNMVNHIITWFATKHYSHKGKKIAKKYIVGKTYMNTMKANTYAIYRGNNVFYETKHYYLPEIGTEYYSSNNVTYTNLQIGLFDMWKPCEVNIDKSQDRIINFTK